MYSKKLFAALFLSEIINIGAFGAIGPASNVEDKELINSATELFNATKIVCSGLSDEISKVSKISKINTAVTGVGTAAAGGALAVGVAKSNAEKEIEKLVNQICENGGCDAESIRKMDLETFHNNVIIPMAEIAKLQDELDKSKKLGNWRTGLMAGTIGTNLASAIISGLHADQSELIQHIEACNAMINSAQKISGQLRVAGISPLEEPIAKKLNNIKTYCNQINIEDAKKIEKRMKGVMGTSIAGAVIGGIGTATSVSANSDKYMDATNRINLTDAEKQRVKSLNTTANIMSGANVGTGLVETGLNISLVTLTKKMIQQAEQCEEALR